MNGSAITGRLHGGDIPPRWTVGQVPLAPADRHPPRDGVIKPLWEKII